MKIVFMFTNPDKQSIIFMPILFNFIVFSNTQNFLYFSEHGVVWS